MSTPGPDPDPESGDFEHPNSTPPTSGANNTDSAHNKNPQSGDKNNPGDKAQPHLDEWIPERALEALRMERTVTPINDESNEDLSRRIFRDNAPAAATSIVHIAIHGQNERTRLAAAQYVSDRVLGKPGDDSFGADNPIKEFIADVVKKAEDFANGKVPKEE
jgi:hypothetical protein